jgi:hypothetical protein
LDELDVLSWPVRTVTRHDPAGRLIEETLPLASSGDRIVRGLRLPWELDRESPASRWWRLTGLKARHQLKVSTPSMNSPNSPRRLNSSFQIGMKLIS